MSVYGLNVETSFQFLTGQCLPASKTDLLHVPPLVHLHRSRIYPVNIELIQKANTNEGFLTANSYSESTLFIQGVS
jgi:hypothetical protein